MNFCINCLHHEADGLSGVHLCRHPSNISLVDGLIEDTRCDVMRFEGDNCRPEGRYFQAKGISYPDLPKSD